MCAESSKSKYFNTLQPLKVVEEGHNNVLAGLVDPTTVFTCILCSSVCMSALNSVTI